MEHSRRNQAAAADAQIEKIEFFWGCCWSCKGKKRKQNHCCKKSRFCSLFLFFFLLQDVMRRSWFCPSNLPLSGLIGAEVPKKKKKEKKAKSFVVWQQTVIWVFFWGGGCFGSKQTALALQGWDKLDRHLFRILGWHQRSLETRFVPRLLLFWSYVGLLCPQWGFFVICWTSFPSVRLKNAHQGKKTTALLSGGNYSKVVLLFCLVS